MTDPVQRSTNSFPAVLPQQQSRNLPNLLDYVEERYPVIPLDKRGRTITEEFQQDMQFASQRAVDWLVRLSSTARGKEMIFSALDGLTGAEREPQVQVAMLDLISGLTNGESGLSFGAATSTGGDDEPSIGPDCACAVTVDGSVAYLSTDLGFRDLFVMSQAALLQTIVLRAGALGLDINATEAFENLCEALDCDLSAASEARHFQSTMIVISGQDVPAILTMSHDS